MAKELQPGGFASSGALSIDVMDGTPRPRPVATARSSEYSAQPYLYTGDRLLVRCVYRGWNAPSVSRHESATLRLVNEEGKVISTATSGIA